MHAEATRVVEVRLFPPSLGGEADEAGDVGVKGRGRARLKTGDDSGEVDEKWRECDIVPEMGMGVKE